MPHAHPRIQRRLVLLPMRTRPMRFLYALFTAGLLSAQPPVAPTNEPTEPAAGDNTGGYNILQSFELGYRWNNVDGDKGMYRSTVNFGRGVRLLSSSLSVQ